MKRRCRVCEKLMIAQMSFLYKNFTRKKRKNSRHEKTMFDYIIVGAGSAGCVLANRLTEDPETSVLLLEAGGNDDAQGIHDPTASISLFQSAVDWAYTTEEESTLNHRKIYWPQGKVLGVPARPTSCCRFVGTIMTMTIGKNWETQGGATLMFCPTSKRPRSGNTVPRTIMEEAVPFVLWTETASAWIERRK